MRVLLTGASGQLGRELDLTCPEHFELTACNQQQLDITQPDQITRVLDEYRPELIINAAAYTAVDRAEQEQKEAFGVNAEAVERLAHSASDSNLRLIHLSTDFVFSGSQNRPYLPDSETGPQGAYGASKLAGEKSVLAVCGSRGVVLRTAWLYSRFQGNFVDTMLRLMMDRDEIAVVVDQIGAPTWTKSLAATVWAIADRSDLYGVYHWTDAGVASWYDFAIAIQEEATALGLLGGACRVLPVISAEYPTSARRPHYSVLDTTRTSADLEIEGAHWRRQLRAMLREKKQLGED